MDRHIAVPFLESVVFLNEVEVISSDHNSPLHLHLHHNSSENTSSDKDIASEGTLLVDVSAFGCISRSLKAEANISDISGDFARLLLSEDRLLVEVDSGLLLEGPLVLVRHYVYFLLRSITDWNHTTKCSKEREVSLIT